MNARPCSTFAALFFRVFPVLSSCCLAGCLCWPSPALAQSRYDDSYYANYLHFMRTDADMVALIRRIADKLPAAERLAFDARYLAFSMQPPNNGACNSPGNLAGVIRHPLKRADGKTNVLYLCREQIVVTLENITSLMLLMMTTSALPDAERDRILERALSQTGASSIKLFDTYRRHGNANPCHPAVHAYVLQRGGDLSCVGQDALVVARYMAPFLRKGLPAIKEVADTSDMDVYFGMAAELQRDMGTWLILFVVMHEVAHMVMGHTDVGDQRNPAENEAQADRYAIERIAPFLDEPTKLIAGPVLLLTQLHLTYVAFLFFAEMEKTGDPAAQPRMQAGLKSSICTMRSMRADPAVPAMVRRLLGLLKDDSPISCR